MQGRTPETGPIGRPNIARAIDRIIASIGAEALWGRFPSLRAMQAQSASPTARGEGALSGPSAIEVFKAIRDAFPQQPDVVDVFLIGAARLDLQQAEILPQERYRYDGSDHDLALEAKIGRRMNLPFEAADYLCHLSIPRRYLYVATPKVACTAIKHCLQQAEMDGTLVYRHYGEEHNHLLSPLLAPIDHPGAYLDAFEGDDWFRFTFVRDPFSRALSCYLDKIVNSVPERIRLLPELGLDPASGIPSFAAFLRAIEASPVERHDFHWAPQSWLTQPQAVRYHFIGRLERFEEDFGHVCDRLGIARQTGVVRHSTQAAGKLAAFYGSEEISLVRSIYGSDFTMFGYDEKPLPSA